jgi:5-hydroxyisourate hydrolase-like protein (transthyretin family)
MTPENTETIIATTMTKHRLDPTAGKPADTVNIMGTATQRDSF